MDFIQQISELLSKETGLAKKELYNLITIPPDPKLGDYSFPCFKLGKNPHQEAENIQKKIVIPLFLSQIKVVGAYLNFFLNQSYLAKLVLTKIHKEKKKYGSSQENKIIVVEFCGPNTNKPLHLGHLRNMALGQAMYNLLSFLGNQVHPVNIVNDRGIHICQSMIAYQKWGNNQQPDKKGDHFVGDYYVLFSKKSKEDEHLKAEAQEMLVKWEFGDKDILKLWKKMNQWVISGFKQTYQRFGIKFEKEYFESQYFEKGKELVLAGLNKKIFERDQQGSIIAALEKYDLPNKVLLREDNTSVYITQDIYLAQLRYQDFHYDQLIYVVASEQQLHFKQLFKILEMLNQPYAQNLYHLSYGLVNLPTGRMKSREGTVVDADDIMDEISSLAEKEVKSRYTNLSEIELKKRAEFISLGAIKFFMLKTDSVKDIIFNPEESLSFEGETGPYLQYTHARADSILRKAGKKVTTKVDFNNLNPEEFELIKKLHEFPEILLKSEKDYKLHHITNYLIKLSQGFNEFYHKYPVISDQEQSMAIRLLIVDSVRQVLEIGLTILGITAPKEM